MARLVEQLRRVMGADPAAPAIEWQGHWWSWGDLSTLTDAVGDLFDQACLPAGARVGVLLRTRAPQAAAFLACVLADKCVVALNPLLPAAKLAEDIGGLGLSMVLGGEADLSATALVKAICTAGAAAVILPDDPRSAPVMKLSVAQPGGPVDRRTTPGVLVEMLTSGTTGPQKRVPLARESFERSLTAALDYEKDAGAGPILRSGVRILNAPITHISGISAVLMTIAGGRKLALMDKFTVEEWRGAIIRHRPKLANVPPAGLRMILDANVPREDLSSLVAIRTGTAPLDPSMVDEFLERYDIPLLQTYGATEFAGAVAGWSLKDFRQRFKEKRGAVGRVHGNIEARVVDADTGAIVPPGDMGVLELRGGQLGDAERWVRTTDLAVLDADQFLWIKGRADSAIIRGGFKVHPDDVVRALEDHPGVREAAVVGIADRRLGQVPVAAFVPAAGQPVPTEAELVEHLRAKLLPFQIPTRIQVMDDLPRTTSMKPALGALKEMFQAAS